MIPIAKPMIGEEEKKAMLSVLDSGRIAQGGRVSEFEDKFAKLCGVKYAAAVNNGTSALHCCMLALGVGQGDEVITTPFSFIATVNSILMVGAIPVFVDIGDDYNIDASKIVDKITPKTKAILPVDLYGQVFDADKVRLIASEHKLLVIEDACQAVNAEFDGKKAGSFGDIAAFSLYATKNLVTGEGGMVTTNIESYYKKVKSLRHHSQNERYDYTGLGYNYRMTDMNAAIGLEQLKKINDFTDKRIKNAKMLSEGLRGLDIILPEIKNGHKHVFHQFTIRVKDRDKFVEYLKKHGVSCGIHYPTPLHLQPHVKGSVGDCPIVEKICSEVVSIPVHPGLSLDDIEQIIKVVTEFFT